MSNVIIHQNPNEHSKPPHKINIKTKPTKRSLRSNKNKINNINNTTNIVSNANNNNKPLKVVHISNPMKFEATPNEFRDLVHKLTGRDAVVEDWCMDDYHRVNHQATVAVSVDGDGSSSYGGVTEDQVVQEVHQDNMSHHDDEGADVTSFSACFGPSDHFSFDSFGTFDDGYIDEDFCAFMGDNR